MQVELLIILDFMCPWSFIGMRSLQIAKKQLQASADALNTSFLPFEFDPPGTYPREGKDWTDYCLGYGDTKAKFLLNEKLPRAFELGSAVGIKFRMDRRIVHTDSVNNALLLAQETVGGAAAEDFALRMLSLHFEHLEDPNNPALLRANLAEVGVPVQKIEDFFAESPDVQHQRNQQNRRAGLQLTGGSVPKFVVSCCDINGQCSEGDTKGLSPTEPQYFLNVLSCLFTEENKGSIFHKTFKDEL